MRRVGIALVLLIGLIAQTAQVVAQDGTDEPAPHAISFTRATIIFPAAIQFVIGVDAAPDAIARVTLTVSQGRRTLRTFEIVDAAPYELRGDETSAELIVTWTLDEPPYPRPFAPVVYEWTVETDDGAQSSAAGEIDYADPRFVWQTDGAAPLTLHWHNERLNGAAIRAELEPVLAALRKHTGRAFEFEFLIYDPDAPLCPPVADPHTGASVPGVLSPVNQQVFDCSLAQHTRAYEPAGVLFVQRPTLGYTELRDLLAARMAHDTYVRLWDEAGADVPAWFAAGLAALYRPRADLAALELVRAALQDGSALTAEALVRELPAEAPLTERALWEAQSAVLVRYLADRHGADGPIALAQSVASGETFDHALGALDDSLPRRLWDTWDQWALSEQAERAAGWSLSAPEAARVSAEEEPRTATPAPKPTRAPSATPTQPPAPSLAASLVPSLTPTLLGHFAPEVIVMQVQPTPLRPPTNTPLPPGSLPAATPRAEAAALVSSVETRLDQTATLGVVLLSSGGALLLIALGLLLRRH